jgi:2-polyprenyl-6-methoxyphenol hydroxylase-like FAD-dependent oxidoreductase
MAPDVVVVGGSLAGCTTAKLFADEGAEVVVLEKHADPAAYKVVCTHFLQPSAMPVLERLGLAPRLEAAGAVENALEFWTRWGWVRPEVPENWPWPAHGLNVRRKVLDPALRELTTSTPGVDYRGGMTVRDVLRDGDRIAGVVARDRSGEAHEIRATLVVAADGRGSPTAKLARVPARLKPHGRFAYSTQFRHAPTASGRSQVWFLDPDMGFSFPNDDGITVIGCMPHRERLGEFKADPEGALRSFIAQLPDGPDTSRAERVGPVIGKVDMTNTARPPAARGMAFVGDAAQATDPLWGVGCGFAFQSAEWLVDAVAPELREGGEALDRGLAAYRREHRRHLAGHHFMASDYASGRAFTSVEKLLYRAGTRDPEIALKLHTLAGRYEALHKILTPATLARAAWVNAREALPV